MGEEIKLGMSAKIPGRVPYVKIHYQDALRRGGIIPRLEKLEGELVMAELQSGAYLLGVLRVLKRSEEDYTRNHVSISTWQGFQGGKVETQNEDWIDLENIVELYIPSPNCITWVHSRGNVEQHEDWLQRKSIYSNFSLMTRISGLHNSTESPLNLTPRETFCMRSRRALSI